MRNFRFPRTRRTASGNRATLSVAVDGPGLQWSWLHCGMDLPSSICFSVARVSVR